MRRCLTQQMSESQLALNKAIKALRTYCVPVNSLYFSFFLVLLPFIHLNTTAVSFQSTPSIGFWSLRGNMFHQWMVDEVLCCCYSGHQKACRPPNYLSMVAKMSDKRSCSVVWQCSMLQHWTHTNMQFLYECSKT